MDIYPNLRSAKMIGMDTETYDPNLLDKGPGAARGDGRILGYSIAAPGYSGYFPLGHPEGNLDPVNTRAWLRDTLSVPDRPVCFANALYDLEFAKADGIEVAGPAYDCQIFEFLLDEERRTYKLDALAEAYFAEGKDESGLAEAVRQCLGKRIGYVPDDHEVKGNLWRLPAKYVAGYAAKDASLALRIVEQQIPLLVAEDLWPVAMLETQVLQCLLSMRFRGIPVDLDRAARVRDEIRVKAKEAQRNLFALAGGEINPRSADQIAPVCDRLGLSYPHTEKGNPSFTSPWMHTQSHPFFKALISVKQLENAADNHVQEKIINMAVGNKVFPSFHPVRKEKEGTDSMSGTRKGRFSSSNPNLQQIPARDPFLGPAIRSCFVPEAGEEWLSADWSQNEPRTTVHYAALCGFRGAEAFRDRYIQDPKTDIHTLTAELARIDRTFAKTIGLGMAYGMGKDKLAASLGVTAAEAVEILQRYNDALPFIKLLGDRCSALARDRGFLRTIGGRKNRFNVYGPAKWSPGVTPLRKEEAIRQWGAVRAWGLHKALNNLVQGSGGDMVKKAMVDCHAAGITPINTIHDELNFSISDRSQAKIVKEIMENVYQMTVPMKVDIEIGPNWGSAVKVEM